MRRYLLVVAVTMLSILGLLGCADPVMVESWPPPEMAYLPFIESAEVPVQVTENNPFDVTVNVSCALKPEALNGIVKSNTPFLGYSQLGARLEQITNHDGPTRVVIRLWIVEPLATGDPVTSLTFSFADLKPGEYVIALESAPSQTQGGMSRLFSWRDYRPVGVDFYGLTPGAVFMEFPLTVVPTED